MLTVALALLCMSSPPGEGAVADPPVHECSHAKAMAHLHEPEEDGQSSGTTRAWNDTDVLSYDLRLEIDPNATTLNGVNVMKVKSKINGLSTFDVRIRSNFAITQVQINGSNASWVRVDTPTIRVTLPAPLNVDQEFELKIAYNGIPVSRGFGSIEFDVQGGFPVVWTLSESTYAYTWWPAKDDNRDKADANLAFIVPADMTVASNGLRQGIDNDPNYPGRRVHRWKTGYPTATYLFAFACTNFNEFTTPSGTWTYGPYTMPLQFFIWPSSDTPANRAGWLASEQMLTTFSDLFGLYPFVTEKYGIAQFGWGGGMEHQTITFQSGFSESVTAHELGHQWWGDNVTCATFNHIWLNEGFATYCEALWLENKPGSSGLPALQDAMQARKPSAVNDSVYVPDATDLNRTFSGNFTYRKGGWVLHMLRHVVGDDKFFDILATYRAAYEGGSATTDELRLVASTVYGQDLTYFFDQWVYQIGAPSYQFATRAVTVGANRFLELYINQTQSASYPTFKMPIDVRTTVGGSLTTLVAWNDADTEHILIPVNGALSGAVTLDPNEWILKAGNTTTTTFVEGPPKLIAVTPPLGTTVSGNSAATLTSTFHKNVNAAAGNFTLVGATFGTIPCSFSYNAAAQTVTLTPSQPLKPDAYTLTISQNVTDVAAGKLLDGEITYPLAPVPLPSGDGLPGGNALVKFTVGPQGDLTGDGVVNQDDLDIVLFYFGGGAGGDLDGDGQTEQDDLDIVLFNFGATL